MKTKLTLLLCALSLAPALLFSQKYNLRGALQDSTQAPLEAATLMLLNPTDSALLFFTRSKADGSFEFKNLAAGDYLLRATYFGYRNLQQALSVPAMLDLGVLKMQPKSTLLGEVQITGEANPVTIKKDTIEYNAGSFKVKENAMVEDLLKKLPGVEVERDGTVRAQGEEVRNVLVEGKKFFGNDPKIATQNLPADAVEKVQVFDKKSDQATFSGVDDGQREKTINLDLKEDKKDGWFGQISAAGGHDLRPDPADARYENRLSLNRFKPAQQFSVLGIGNNVNRSGFSLDDYMAFSGAMRQMMGGGGGGMRLQFNLDEDNSIPLDFGGQNDGFLKTWAGGLNFNQEYGQKRKGDLNASYFFSQSDRDYARATNRESFLPTGNFVATQDQTENTATDNHRLNLTLDQKIDSFNSVQLTSAFTHTQRNTSNHSASETLDAYGQRSNSGDRTYGSDGTGTSWNGGLLFRHKFAKKGRNATANLTAGLNRNDAESDAFSENIFYDDGNTVLRRDTISQHQRFSNDVWNFGARATFTEPLGKRRYLEFSYQYNMRDNNADKDVYDVSAGERNFNDTLSNAYTNRFDYHRAGLGLRLNKKNWNGSVGLDAQSATLDGEVLSGSGQPVRQTFRHLLPRLEFNYEFGSNRNLRTDYSTSIEPPTVQQLQPVPDLSDPLNIVEGNPDLRPAYRHDFNAGFSQFDPATMRSFFVNLNFSYTRDRIVNAQSVDSFFVRRFRPVNVASDYQLFGMMAFGIPWKRLNSRFNLRTEGALNRGLNFINDIENATTRTELSEVLSWEFTPAEWFTFSASAELSWNQTRYSIDRAFNQDYWRQIYTAAADVELPLGWAFNTSLDLTRNTGLSQGYDQTIPIWTASLSKFFLKGKRGQLTLAVHDLLNENVGIRRNANLNYVEDVRTASLGRYAMLRFTYSLNKVGGQGAPGVRMIIRR